MKIVNIYLRAVEDKERTRLALFDSNRNGAIDDLTTEVPRGATVIWRLDCNSGIKDITKIVSKEGKRNVFKTDPVKRRFFRGFFLLISKEAEGEEAYNIEFILCDGKKVIIDPYIRIKPPQP